MARLTCLIFILLPHLVYGSVKETYSTTFLAFVKSVNPAAPDASVLDMATLNWSLSEGNWNLAQRLSSEENNESGNFKVAAWCPMKRWPQYDLLGSHINLIVQEARRLGILPRGKIVDQDQMDHLKELLTREPELGTWIVAHAFIRAYKKYGLDGASHFWQTGKTAHLSKKYVEDDPYLKSIRQGERCFNNMRPGVPRKAAPNSSWRKR